MLEDNRTIWYYLSSVGKCWNSILYLAQLSIKHEANKMFSDTEDTKHLTPAIPSYLVILQWTWGKKVHSCNGYFTIRYRQKVWRYAEGKFFFSQQQKWKAIWGQNVQGKSGLKYESKLWHVLGNYDMLQKKIHLILTIAMYGQT